MFDTPVSLLASLEDWFVELVAGEASRARRADAFDRITGTGVMILPDDTQDETDADPA
jgi:hypothetical protein